MPNLDKTGPLGKGAMTGRGRGRCRGDRKKEPENSEVQINESKDEIYGIGRGGRPRGAGGWGNRFRVGFRKGFRGGKNHGFGRRSGDK